MIWVTVFGALQLAYNISLNHRRVNSICDPSVKCTKPINSEIHSIYD
jgi:hypothetical protein